MPIPRVPRNVDSRGQAGSIVPRPGDIRYDDVQVGGGPYGGGQSPLYDLLAKQASLRNAMAEQQLKMMKQQLREVQSPKRRALGPRAPRGQVQGGRGVNERGRAGMMAQSLLASPGAYRGDPFGAMNIQDMIASIGIPASQRGLMQTGGLLASQGRGGIASGQTPEYTNPYGFAGEAPGMARGQDYGYTSPLRGLGPQGKGYEEGSLPDIVPEKETLDEYQEGTLSPDIQVAQRLVDEAKKLSADSDEAKKLMSKARKLVRKAGFGFQKGGGAAATRKLFGTAGKFSVAALLDPFLGAVQNDPEGAELLRSMGIDAPSEKWYEQGSLPGTVPETGSYKLHKGEIVLQEEQVDEPLLNALIGDKLRKMRSGQIKQKGKKKGKSYKAGTLGSYKDGLDVTDPENSALMRLIGKFTGEYEGPVLNRSPHDPSQPITGIGPEPGFLAEGGTEGLKERIREGLQIPNEAPEGAAIAEWLEATPQEEQGIDTLGGTAQSGGPEYFKTPDVQAAPPSYDEQVDIARGRAQGGDFGIGDPLTLTGSRDPQSEDYVPEGTINDPTWRKEQDAIMLANASRSKSEQINRYLAGQGSNIDPVTFKSLNDEIGRLDKVATNFDKQQHQRDEFAKDRGLELEKSYMAFQSAAAKAEASGEEVDRDIRSDLQRAVVKLEDKMLDFIKGGASEEVIEEQARRLARAQFKLFEGEKTQEDLDAYENELVEQYLAMR